MGALGVCVDKEVVVVVGGEREDGGVGVDSVVVDGRHDDVYCHCTRGCTMNTCLSLSGNAEEGLRRIFEKKSSIP